MDAYQSRIPMPHCSKVVLAFNKWRHCSLLHKRLRLTVGAHVLFPVARPEFTCVSTRLQLAELHDVLERTTKKILLQQWRNSAVAQRFHTRQLRLRYLGLWQVLCQRHVCDTRDLM